MRSMTGFGRAEGPVGTASFTVEAKSVNHRYLDVRFRLPSAFSSWEGALLELVKARFERGSFDILVRPQGSGASGGARFQGDLTAAKSFVQAVQDVAQGLNVALVPSVEAMVMTGKIFVSAEEAPVGDAGLSQLRELVDTALDGVAAMRESEGRKLAEFLRSGCQEIAQLTQSARTIAAQHPAQVRKKLEARIAQWGLGQGDPQRLEWEVAFYADRADITEELDRLQSHAQAFESLLKESGGVGRKLDFLTQEMHREINTMGSKAGAVELTRLTVEGKQRIEKLREQVQNVE